MADLNKNDLDRYITGNWGEDSVSDDEDMCPFCGVETDDCDCDDEDEA
jgi:hypothetical protein